MVFGLNERLQEQRLLNRMSQKEVAAAIGVSPSIISNYESAERVPSVENLMALAGLYRCSVDYLLGIQSNNRIDIDTSMLTDKQVKLLQDFLLELHVKKSLEDLNERTRESAERQAANRQKEWEP